MRRRNPLILLFDLLEIIGQLITKYPLILTSAFDKLYSIPKSNFSRKYSNLSTPYTNSWIDTHLELSYLH